MDSKNHTHWIEIKYKRICENIGNLETIIFVEAIMYILYALYISIQISLIDVNNICNEWSSHFEPAT